MTDHPAEMPTSDVVARFCAAVVADNEEVVNECLARYGARIINEKDANGRTALLSAVYMARVGMVRLLLAHNPDLERRDRQGYTAFALACVGGMHHVMAMLREKGASPDPRNRQGHTILAECVGGMRVRQVGQLLKMGASPNAMDMDGNTPLMWAIYKAEQQKNPSYGRNMALLLLKHGALLNIKNAKHETPLMWAARYGHTVTVSLLLKNGAVWDDKSDTGATAEDIARKHGHIETADYIFNCEAAARTRHEALMGKLKPVRTGAVVFKRKSP